MNKRLVINLSGKLLLLEALLMLPSLVVSIYYQDGDAMAFVYALIPLTICGLISQLVHADRDVLEAREGLAVSGLAWILLSLFGALPFLFSGMTDNFVDAWFECVSGFTTTGASILTEIETQGRGVLFWRSFTHWIGGMGVLILTLALIPKVTGRASHLARAESPGPTFSKFTPRLQDTAKTLYLIYVALSISQVIALLIAGMPLYDSLIHTFGTAGTGGFSNRNLSVGAYDNAAVDVIITIYMLLFGVNFVVYFHMLRRDFRGAVHNEEVKIYLIIAFSAIALTTWKVLPHYGGDFGEALRRASFQVASIISTTGYATADFNLWPQLTRVLLVLLMIIGSCAGSTAGGVKVVRVSLIFKASLREVRHTFRPRKTEIIRMDKKPVSEQIVTQLGSFLFFYALLLAFGALLIAAFGFDLETSLTAPIACLSNIGPGLSTIGPMGNFASMPVVCKIYLSFLMLIGRLEFYPILVLLAPSFWRKH